MRPLGIPATNDKIVQEVWRHLLEAIYEPVFQDSSHGFRPERSCHTALKTIAKWRGTKWFIEFDIQGYFDNIDHQILVRLLEKKIDDYKFINIIRKMLKAGYMENWTFNKTYSGTPQGGVISPLLANVYLHELDCFVMTLAETYTKGKARKHDLAYRAMRSRVVRLNRRIDQEIDMTKRQELIERKKAMHRAMQTFPSKDQYDPAFRRLRYCRYADDFALSVIGPKSEAVEIFETIKDFLDQDLKLEIANEKSGIKHHAESIRFLGYDITIKNCERVVKTRSQGRHTKIRSLKGDVELRVPEERLQKFVASHHYGNWETMKATCRTYLINLSDVEIILQFNAELRGIAQYYALAHNYHGKSGRLVYLARVSFLKTLAGKHRTTYAHIAKMLDRGRYLAVKYKAKEYKLFKAKDVARNTLYDKDDYPPTALYKAHTGILERMEANKCEYCEAEGGYFEVHHVHKLADMKDGKEPWQKLMIARKRKTIVLCIHCHDQLHAGTLPDWRHLRK
jgi:RNA-directed DNA polymerase